MPRYTIDGEHTYEGVPSPAGQWNGWETPMFRRPEVEQMLTDMGLDYEFNDPADERVCVFENASDPDTWTIYVPHRGGYYNIGACRWTWMLADEA